MTIAGPAGPDGRDATAPEVAVLIAGAGPVGAALALALGRAGVATALLDLAPPPPVPQPDAPLDLRVSALSARTVQWLETLGAWPRISPARHTPYRALDVWEDGARIRFDAADIGEADLGALVENRALVAALHVALDECPSVRRLAHGEVHALAAGARHIAVHTSAGERCTAALVVGAEGAHSAVRTLAGIGAVRTDFRHSALVTHVRTQHPHRHVACQRFLPGGPLALLPLPDGRVSVVWSCAPAHAQALTELPEADFAAALAQASDWRLGEVLECDRRAVIPLQGLHAARYISARVALAGDSAHVVHPLAGLGATLGLDDAAALADRVTDAAARGADPGGAGLLRRYERARRAGNAPLIGGIEALRRLYGVRTGPLPALRRAGLRLTNHSGPLKQAITRLATGA